MGKVIEGYLIKVLEWVLLVLLSNIVLLLFPKTIGLTYLIKVLEGLLLGSTFIKYPSTTFPKNNRTS